MKILRVYLPDQNPQRAQHRRRLLILKAFLWKIGPTLLVVDRGTPELPALSEIYGPDGDLV
jgi:hypothetical protein